MQLERSYFRRLKFEAMITETASFPGVLTVQFGLLSKPVDPK